MKFFRLRPLPNLAWMSLLTCFALSVASGWASAGTLVGIAGRSASGKTTLAKGLRDILESQFHYQTCHLSLDSYYRPLAEQSEMITLQFAQESIIVPNWDHPSALDFQKIRTDLVDLKSGKKVNVPIYNFTQNDQVGFEKLGPCEIVLVEGILAFYDPEVQKLLDLKYYVDLEADTLLTRRVKRDVETRGKSQEHVHAWVTQVEALMYQKFVKPSLETEGMIFIRGDGSPEDLESLAREVHGFKFIENIL